jgi:hypothetical protein
VDAVSFFVYATKGGSKRQEGRLARGKGAGDKDPLALAHSPAVSLGGFLIIGSPLHIADETLFFA